MLKWLPAMLSEGGLLFAYAHETNIGKDSAFLFTFEPAKVLLMAEPWMWVRVTMSHSFQRHLSDDAPHTGALKVMDADQDVPSEDDAEELVSVDRMEALLGCY